LPELAYRAAVECQLTLPPSPLSPEERRSVFGDDVEGVRVEPRESPPVEACSRSGEAGGTLHYVRPYVERESLRDRLTRGERLPRDDRFGAMGHDGAGEGSAWQCTPAAPNAHRPARRTEWDA